MFIAETRISTTFSTRSPGNTADGSFACFWIEAVVVKELVPMGSPYLNFSSFVASQAGDLLELGVVLMNTNRDTF